jgi:hypothetical protein
MKRRRFVQGLMAMPALAAGVKTAIAEADTFLGAEIPITIDHSKVRPPIPMEIGRFESFRIIETSELRKAIMESEKFGAGFVKFNRHVPYEDIYKKPGEE